MALVSTDLAKAHLNIIGNHDDELIELYINAAENWLSDYIGPVTTSEDEPVPSVLLIGSDDIKLAVLMLTAHYYENRESASHVALQMAPFGVLSIANKYRENWFGEPDAVEE
ncbi:MAG: hypothetical protein MnENMB40S_22670 [Rhizobiaceae bacterium MnEN-MB40S]|nr:MAG: hypothetical protein MnENMB40S_22670 [Rhizobiaceae bacterium MnEN-MB40S]